MSKITLSLSLSFGLLEKIFISFSHVSCDHGPEDLIRNATRGTNVDFDKLEQKNNRRWKRDDSDPKKASGDEGRPKRLANRRANLPIGDSFFPVRTLHWVY